MGCHRCGPRQHPRDAGRWGVTLGSLFSGIGGLELGLDACGLGPVVWQCDSDPYARAVLEKHWPNVTRYNDVRDIDASVTRPDVICGGFPCQPHSLAGKRRGTADVRWLWPEFARIIEAVRPAAVFIENVPGLRTSGLRDVLADLARLGFDAEWDLFSAAETGAPHRRQRLFVLAYADGELSGDESRWPSGPHRSISAVSSDVGADGCITRPRRWPARPSMGGVASGVPARAHRLRLLGNACVPAQAALAWRTLSARITNPGDTPNGR